MCTSLLSRFKYVIGIGVGAGAYVLAKFAVSLGLGWAGPELPLPAVSLGQGDEQELTPSGRLLGVRRARQQCLGHGGLAVLPQVSHRSQDRATSAPCSACAVDSGAGGGLPWVHLPVLLSITPLAYCSSSSPTWSKVWSS